MMSVHSINVMKSNNAMTRGRLLVFRHKSHAAPATMRHYYEMKMRDLHCQYSVASKVRITKTLSRPKKNGAARIQVFRQSRCIFQDAHLRLELRCARHCYDVVRTGRSRGRSHSRTSNASNVPDQASAPDVFCEIFFMFTELRKWRLSLEMRLA